VPSRWFSRPLLGTFNKKKENNYTLTDDSSKIITKFALLNPKDQLT
jgi:hypothetical protein